MRYLHTMIRVNDLDAALRFFVHQLGLVETRRKDVPAGKFTLVFLATAPGEPELELTHNWDNTQPYDSGRNFGHVAYEVDDIYQTCSHLAESGVVINRPPRDGHMAFVRSPDGISVELLQKGGPRPPIDPWQDMPNSGEW